MHQADRPESSTSRAPNAVIDELSSLPTPPHHAVQFYESEEFLCHVVARYFIGGLLAGEPAVLIITPERARGIFERLKAGEYDVERGLASGQITLLDARETLDKFMSGGMPDWGRFEAVVGGAIEKSAACGKHARVRAVGEMVDLLWRDGNPQAAIRLEEFWSELSKTRPFTLLCGYLMGNFVKEAHGEQFRRICEAHSHVIPAETWSNSDDPEIQTREIAVLQQRARSLEAEVKLRQELEAALRDALASLRRSEEEARRSKQELQDFVDNAAEGLMSIGPDGVILWANQAELDLVGCTRDEYVGHHITEFRGEREVVEDILTRLARNETVRNREVQVRRKDGSVRHVLVNSNVLWENGKFVHTRCLSRDITPRKKAHEALAFFADASALLSSSLDHETTLAGLADLAVPRIADGCAVELARDPALPKGSVVVGRFEPGASLAPAVASVLRTGKPVMHGNALLVVPMTARGRVLGTIALGATQPDRRFEPSDLEMAEELGRRAALAIENARLYHEAREADRRKDEFLAMLGDELRNPLAPILTALQLMKLRGTAGEREHTMIERQVRHLNRLIDDLLDVSRITRGKVQLQKEPVELAGVLAKAIEMASPLFEARSHSLSIDVTRHPLLIDGDPVRLAQVFANLLVNAAKYTEPGGKIIVAARREKGQVSISIKDNGIGIAAEVLPKLFDLFVQAERAIDRSQGGLGIGLALARSMVDLHGGTITARSEGPGRGSEFIVRLPLSVTRSVPAEASAAEASAPAPRPSGLRILLVDDNLDAVEVLAEALRSFGHEVAVAHDGPEALTVARDFRPNTALLDIGLPVMDGYELAMALRKVQGPDPLRLIALTGYGQDADKARSQGAGFDVHLVKPVDLDTVAALLDDAKTG